MSSNGSILSFFFVLFFVNLALSQFGFATLVVIDVVLFMFAYFIWFLSAIALRIKEPDLERPYRIPFGTKGMIIMTVAPAIICVTAFFTNGLNYLIGGSLGLLTGPVFYVIFKKKYGGLDNTKKLSAGQKKGVAALSAAILACLVAGSVLLFLQSISSRDSFDEAFNSSLSANYDRERGKYIISEDSFAMDMTDRNNEDAETRIWYYYGDLTGDIYVYDETGDMEEFSQTAFMIYEQLSGAGLSQIDIYSDDYWFVAYEDDEYTDFTDILYYLSGD